MSHKGQSRLGGGKLQVQPCPQCPVSDGRSRKRRPVVKGQQRPFAAQKNGKHFRRQSTREVGHRCGCRVIFW